MRPIRFALFFIFLMLIAVPIFAETSDPPAVGEAFGKPILKEEFDFAFKTTGIFNVSSQNSDREQERRNETWKHIIFLREAQKRGIQPSQAEITQELTRLLSEKNINVGSYNYHEFIKSNFQEDSVVFEKRVQNILTVKKILDTILHPSTPNQDAQKDIEDILKNANIKDYARDKVVVLETTQGSMELALYPTVAPKTCENFLGLIESKYYDGLLFHRIIKGFMIQGGDPTGTGMGGQSIWGKPFEDEVTKDVQFAKDGILAMANSGPGTNVSQFFITLAPTPHLNMKHTIFGQIISGNDVLKKLGDTETGEKDRPKSDQKIITMTLKKWPTSLTF